MMIFGQGFSALQVLIAIVAFSLAITIALVLHEWAHAWAAYKSGDATAKMMGRMSINPRRHVEPLGLVSFIFVGIGWAKPVPVNPFNYRNFRRGNFFVSIAGIVVNFILAIVFSLALALMLRFTELELVNILRNPDGVATWVWMLGFFFYITAFLNVALMIFNLLPIYPLDGYNILRSFTKPDNRYMQFVRNNTHWLLITVILVLVFSGLFGLMRNGIINLLLGFWSLIF